MVKRTVEVELTAKDRGLSGSLDKLIGQFEEMSDVVKRLKLGETINSSFNLARTSLDELTQSFKRGEIGAEQYEDATRRIQRAFGLVTPETERAAARMQELQQAFAKGEISAEDYERELLDLAKTLDKVEDEGRQTGGVLQGIAQGIGQSIGNMAMGAVQQLPQMAMEIVNLGLVSETTTHRFEAFAGGTEQASAYLQAFQDATGGAVPKLDAMAGAAKMLQMGLVENADEMEVMAAIATRLGNQTMSAGDRISDFSALLANRSIPRLDNFGISSGKVRQRVEELKEAGYDLDQAFKLAVLEQGRISLEKLGDTSDSTANKVAKVQAAIADAKVGFGELAVEALSGAGSVDDFAGRVRNLPNTLRQALKWLDAVQYGIIEMGQQERLSGFGEGFSDSLKRSAAAMVDWKVESEEVRYAHYNTAQAAEEESQAIDHLTYVTEEMEQAGIRYGKSGGEILHTILETTRALEQQAPVVEAITGTMDRAAQLRLSMDWTRQLESMEESTEKFAGRREEIERAHEEKLTELRKRGQATAIRIDAAAEQEKLRALQRKLEIALVEQATYTDKTAQATQMRKDDQIASLQGEIAEQQKLLDDYAAGRLVRAGENVNALIAEEDRLHQARITALDEEMAKQQQIQEQAMGNMMLSAFDMWAETKDIPENQKEEWVKRTLEMRTAIAEEYGLVAEGASELVADMVEEWDTWADGTRASTEEVVGYLDAVIGATEEERRKLLELTAHTYWVRVRYDVAGRPDDIPEARGPGLQRGTEYWRGGMAMVGERGPEMVYLPRGSRVVPNVDSHDVVNIYSEAAGARYMHRRDVRRAAIGSLM